MTQRPSRRSRIDADERTTLLALLDAQRASVIGRLTGLTDEEARWSPVSSGTNLLGLVRHLSAGEYDWVIWSYAGAEGDLRDLEMAVEPGTTIDQVVRHYRAMSSRCNQIALSCGDLAARGARSWGPEPAHSMRWILMHLLEETARHAGHADILRERLDDRRGA